MEKTKKTGLARGKILPQPSGTGTALPLSPWTSYGLPGLDLPRIFASLRQLHESPAAALGRWSRRYRNKSSHVLPFRPAQDPNASSCQNGLRLVGAVGDIYTVSASSVFIAVRCSLYIGLDPVLKKQVSPLHRVCDGANHKHRLAHKYHLSVFITRVCYKQAL